MQIFYRRDAAPGSTGRRFVSLLAALMEFKKAIGEYSGINVPVTKLASHRTSDPPSS
jgi:hypothetical protein